MAGGGGVVRSGSGGVARAAGSERLTVLLPRRFQARLLVGQTLSLSACHSISGTVLACWATGPCVPSQIAMFFLYALKPGFGYTREHPLDAEYRAKYHKLRRMQEIVNPEAAAIRKRRCALGRDVI
eukprot:42190-Rhodomonas_salina.1